MANATSAHMAACSSPVRTPGWGGTGVCLWSIPRNGGGGCTDIQSNTLNLTMCQTAATPSFQPIFFPSAYVRPE